MGVSFHPTSSCINESNLNNPRPRCSRICFVDDSKFQLGSCGQPSQYFSYWCFNTLYPI